MSDLPDNVIPDAQARKMQRIAWLQAAMANATMIDHHTGQLAAWHQELDALMSGKRYGTDEIGRTEASGGVPGQ